MQSNNEALTALRGASEGGRGGSLKVLGVRVNRSPDPSPEKVVQGIGGSPAVLDPEDGGEGGGESGGGGAPGGKTPPAATSDEAVV